MFVKRVSDTLLILGFSCTRIQNTVKWLQKLLPTVHEIHFYIPFYAYKHIVDHFSDPTISFHLHDIPLLTTTNDRDRLVADIESVPSSVVRICIVQDPVAGALGSA